MQKTNRFFISGAVFAILAVAILAHGSFFSIGFAGDGRGNLPRELRLGVEIGILRNAELSSSQLNRSIDRFSFAEKLCTILDLTGISDLETPKALVKAGILGSRHMSGKISRKEALETFARVAIHLANQGKLSLPDAKATNFRDYRVPAKFDSAVSYLQSKFVVRGYPNGSLGSNRRLSRKEAVFFIYRLYESISSDLMSKRTLDGICFIDIPLSHPLMKSIENLTKAGAFDKVMLRPSFDGEAHVSKNDLIEFVSGIFAKTGQEMDHDRLRNIFPGASRESVASRRQLALMLELVLDTIAKDKLSAQKIAYADVTLDNPEFEALIKLAGCNITMGQGDGNFVANAGVSWNETVKLLDAVIKFAGITGPVEARPSKLAQKSDVENYKAILIAKRERIRKILNRGK